MKLMVQIAAIGISVFIVHCGVSKSLHESSLNDGSKTNAGIALSARTIPVAKDGYFVKMNVSAYCPCEKCCGRFADGFTSSGVVADGLIIAAPPKYPFGTIMEVPGYGKAVVQDRGGVIKGNKIDLLFPTHQEALNWGRQHLDVKVYEWAM